MSLKNFIIVASMLPFKNEFLKKMIVIYFLTQPPNLHFYASLVVCAL